MPVKKHCLICNGSLIPGIPFKSIYTQRASNELPQGRHNKDSAPSVCPSPAVSSFPKRTSERSEPGGRTEAIMHTQPVPDGTSGAQRMLGDISLAVSSPTQRAMEDQLRHSGSGTLCNATPMLSHVLPPSPQVAGSIQQANYFSKHITPGSPHGAMPCHNVVASSPQVLIPGDGAVAPITHVAMSSEQAVAPATHMSMPSHQVLVPSPLVTMPSEQILVSNPRITMPNQQVVTQSPQLTMSSHDVLALNSHLTITGQKNLASTSHLSVSSQDLVATNLRLAMSSEQVLASNPHVAIQSAQGSINQLPQSPQVMVPNQQAVVLSEQATALTHEVATPPPQHHNYQQVATPSSEHQQGGPPGSQQVSPPPNYPDLQLSSVRAHHQQVALQEYNPTLTPSYTAASVDPSVTLTPSYTAATPVPTVTQIQVMQANSEVLTSSTTTVGPTEPVMTMNQPPVVASTVHQALTVSSTAHHPLAVSATERHQLALTSAEPHQLNTTSAEHQPLITSTRHQPLTLTSIDHRPLIVKSTEHQHLAVTSTEHHQLAVTATEHPPLTVTSTEHHQLAVPSTEHQLAVTSTEHQPLSVTSTEHPPLTVPSTVNQHTPMTQQQSSGMLDGQSHHPAKEHLQHDYHHETYPEVSQAMTDTFMQLGTTMEQQLVNVPYVMPPVSTQASLTAAAQTMVTYVLPPVSTQTNPVAANVQTPSYDAYATNSVYTSAQWDHAVQSTGGISMDEVADRFTMSPTEQGSTSQSVPVRQAKGFQGGQEYILQGANVLRHVLMQQQQQAQHQVQVVSHHQSDIIETTPTPPQQSLPATLPPLISSQPRERTTTQAAVTKVKVFPAGLKQEKVEKISMPKETENKVKVEKEKGEKAAVRTKAIGKKDLSGELKDRLESALQLSLTGRVCHSPYVCQACEHKLSEVELYYKVVSEFRQSFFKTAHAHGIKDSDIAEGLTITTEQHTSPKNLLAGFLSQPPGGITGSSWQELISPGLLDSAISDNANWGEKTLKMHQKEIPKVPSKTNEQKPVDKTGERLQPAVLPKKRGRPRKFPLPVKSEPVRLALPPRLKLPRREAKVRTVEPPLKRRKLLRVIRHKVTPPVEVDDGGTTEEDDTFAEIDDDPLDDDWKPSPGNKQPAIGDPLVRVKAEAVKVDGVKAEGSKVIDSKEQDDDLEADDSSTDEGDGDVKDVLASLAQHVKKPMYQCVICSKSFAGVTVLKFHIQKKHKHTIITEPYKCAACGETFESPSGVRLHVKMHIDERSRTCEVCEKSYGSVAALNLHIRNKHPLMRKRMGKFPCGKCGKRFSCIQSLQMHTRTQHEAEREVHTCTVCQRHFLDKERKVNHESKCEKDMEKLNLVRDMQAERSFICKICNASYKNKSAFKQHHYTHKDEKPHQCKVCESKFLYKKSLTDHVAAVHRGERRMKAFKCEVCGHGYSHAGDLAKHMTLHSGKFCCPTCNKPCAGSYKLKEHMRIHTGEKPYKCDVCSASFTQAAGLKSHQYTHKTNKRFLCTICGMQFAHRTTFRRHGMTHTGERPYKCSICNKGFQFDWVLKDHIKTHTGEKPHLCSICGKSFTQPQHLKTHLRIHTGEKPYRCAHCDVSYRHLSSYNQHKRNCPITGGANEKKEARAKARKIIAPSLVTSLQPAQLSTLQTADILAHLTRPSATYMTTDDPAINILDESHMHIPTHHSLIGPPSPPPHLTRVTLPETTTSIGSPNYQTTQSPQLHQSGRHLLEMGTLPQDLTQMQHAALQPASVGMQPMDMTSSGAALAMGTTQGQQQQQQQQHEQTVQTFNLMQTGYTQNYVH